MTQTDSTQILNVITVQQNFHMLHILTLRVCLEIHTVFSPVIYMSLFAKVNIFSCLKNARLNAWSGMTEPSLTQRIRASPGFSLEA